MSETTRATVAATDGNCVECTAPENMFAPEWADVTSENKVLVVEHGLPCEGGGVIGHWCITHNCHWHKIRQWRDCEGGAS